MKLKILHFVSGLGIGGIENLVVNLSVQQKKRDNEVSILINSGKANHYKEIKKNNINVIVLNISSGYSINFFKMKKINKIFKKFDIIHFHTFSLIHFLALNKLKCIYTIHGSSKGVRQENLIKYHIRESLKKYFLNRVSFFVANSKFTLRLSKDHYGLKNISKKVILNGSKIDIMISNIKNNYNNEFIIGLVTRFTKRKRIDRLINAFYMFIHKGGNGKLVIVGDGQTFEEIKTLIEDKNLSSYVILEGYDIEVGKYYSTFDITVFPSESEPFGLVALEAYCFGLPVLAFHDSGGLKEIIEPLEPQNIVDDEENLSLRMLYYYKNKDRISIKSNERKMYILNNFSIDRMESEYKNIYKSLLNP